MPELAIKHNTRDIKEDRRIIIELLQEGGYTANFITLLVRDWVEHLAAEDPEQHSSLSMRLAKRINQALNPTVLTPEG
jgi:hypothetical protein